MVLGWVRRCFSLINYASYILIPYMSLGRSPCGSFVLKDDKSSTKVADFNDQSMCVCMLPS